MATFNPYQEIYELRTELISILLSMNLLLSEMIYVSNPAYQKLRKQYKAVKQRIRRLQSQEYRETEH